MQKIITTIGLSLLIVTLTGCATNRQNGEVLGAITGAAAGKTLGGTGGAIIGAAVGAAAGGSVGQSIDHQQSSPMVVQVPQEQIVQVAPPTVVYVKPYWPAPHIGMNWVYVPRYGYGWHHPRHGFYYRTPRRGH
jgi:Glycine zipper